MKSPFKKDKSNSLLIAGIAGGAIAAGIITALIIRHRHELAEAAAEVKEHAMDYLEKQKSKLKQHKSDVNDLTDVVAKNL